ncbi:hypothetical protein ACS0TY_004460 [Phlomoides rotata]
MGKTGKWLRSLFSSKKPSPGSSFEPSKNKFYEEYSLASPYIEGLDANKHAIAVAAATAAVAEAALAAAQAAAEVVRLTSGGGSGVNIPAYISRDRRRGAAAIKIQSAFRAYLARRALRALKGLVKLQALVRGRIVRKQTADMLRRMQAMARIQARASAHRTHSPNTNITFSNSRPPGVASAKSYYQRADNAKHGGYISKQMQEYKSRSHLPSNWLNHWMEQHSWNNGGTGDDERSDKILEIDTWKPRQTTRRSDRRMGREHSRMGPNPSVSSEEVSSMISGDQVAAEISPRVHSASTGNVRGPFTPTRSECCRSLFGDYIGHPNFMANTESSRAKVRSQSAPKQRMRLDGVGGSSTFGQSVWQSDTVSEKGFVPPANYRSGYMKRHGTPTPEGISSSYTGYRR